MLGNVVGVPVIEVIASVMEVFVELITVASIADEFVVVAKNSVVGYLVINICLDEIVMIAVFDHFWLPLNIQVVHPTRLIVFDFVDKLIDFFFEQPVKKNFVVIKIYTTDKKPITVKPCLSE